MNRRSPTGSIGIIGTGEMGRPVVDRLVGAGFDVAVYARRPEVRSELAALGIELTDSVAALGSRCTIVLIYVFTDDQVRSVALDDGLVEAMATDSTLVIHTTGSPATAHAIAAQAESKGVGVLDAAGSGGPADVAAGNLNLFVGGDAAHFQRCKPVFESYASEITHFGPLGSGQMVKLINNLMFASQVQLALDAAQIATAFDIDEVQLAKVLHTCSGQSYSLDLVGAMGSADRLLATAGPYIHKDVVVARAVAEAVGVPLGTIGAVTDTLLERTGNAEPEHPNGDHQ